jgi:hypothetical protein
MQLVAPDYRSLFEELLSLPFDAASSKKQARGRQFERVLHALLSAENDTLAKLQAASHTSGDAARPLPRLTIALAEVICNGRDAVANESAEALQRRANISAVCQLQLVVSPRRRLGSPFDAAGTAATTTARSMIRV